MDPVLRGTGHLAGIVAASFESDDSAVLDLRGARRAAGFSSVFLQVAVMMDGRAGDEKAIDVGQREPNRYVEFLKTLRLKR